MKKKFLILLVCITVGVVAAAGIILMKRSNENTTNNTDLNESKVETSKTEVPEEYIGIYTVEDFLKFNTQEYALDGKYILMNDIDFSSIKEFIPIGHQEGFTYPKAFTGVLDGNYYTISNLNLKSSKELQGNIGLFAEIDAGVVKNLNIEDAQSIINQVPSSSTRFGILAGKINNSLIENCNFINIKFEINGTEHLGRIGTIAGELNGSTYDSQRYEGYVEKDENSNPELSVVKNVNVDVTLTGNHIHQYTTEFGGAFGGISSDYGVQIKVEDVIVNLKSDNEYVSTSGFASIVTGVEIEKCGTNVDINSKNADEVAGFICSGLRSRINQCYSKGNIVANDNVAGFVYSSSKLSMDIQDSGITNSYSTVNITVAADNPKVANFQYFSEWRVKNIYASGIITHIDGGEIDKAFVWDDDGVIENAYHNIKEINSNGYIMGIEEFKEKNPNTLIGVTEEEMKMKSSYTSFDFENIWAIDEGESTPYLQFEK